MNQRLEPEHEGPERLTRPGAAWALRQPQPPGHTPPSTIRHKGPSPRVRPTVGHSLRPSRGPGQGLILESQSRRRMLIPQRWLSLCNRDAPKKRDFTTDDGGGAVEKNTNPFSLGESCQLGHERRLGSSCPWGGVRNEARREPGGAVGSPARTGEGQPTAGCPPCSEGRTESTRQRPPWAGTHRQGSLQKSERREGGDMPGRRALRHGWHTGETAWPQGAEVEVGWRRWPVRVVGGQLPRRLPFQTGGKGQPPRAAGKPRRWEPFVSFPNSKGPCCVSDPDSKPQGTLASLTPRRSLSCGSRGAWEIEAHKPVLEVYE